MASTSASLHESPTALSSETVDRHRAIASLMEELEAVDWYDQRVEATDNAELKAILAHNRDEEKEHAMMVLEWLRRRDPKLDEQLRRFLYTERPLGELAKEEEAGEPETAASGGGGAGDGSLGIGSLREATR